MDKIRNIMFMSVTFVLYTGCGHFQTSEKTPIYDILAQQYARKFVEGFWPKPELFDENEEYSKEYNKLVEKYKNYEDNLEAFRKHLAREQYPLMILRGGIDYTMTLDEMRQKIKEKFSEIKKKGLIISKDEFKKIEKNYFTIRKHEDLTRIWGREYLKGKINNSEYLQKRYDVPNYVIVADDDPDHIKLKLQFSTLFPTFGHLENATIYFIKIIGKPSAFSYEVKVNLRGISYADFASDSNVIRDNKTGKYYIVDTGTDSFKIEGMPSRVNAMLEYATERFLYLNKKILGGKLNYTYDINLSVKK